MINAMFCPLCSNYGDFSFPGFTNVCGFTYKTLSEGMKRLILKGYEVNTKCTNTFKLHLHIKLHIFHIKQYRSGTVNSNTVNSKFHLIRNFLEIFARFLSFHV